MGLGDVPVMVGAGTDLERFATEVTGYGLHGAEKLFGIGGTVGDAVRINAGGIGNIISGVVCLDPSDGSKRKFTAAECGFGEGTSVFSESVRYTVSSILVRLSRD